MNWVCIDCGARQPEQGKCRTCGHDDTLDLRDEKVRELMRDVDMRITDRREARFRYLGVGVGMAIVILLWTLPGYWDLRHHYFALPALMDQWFLMAVIGLGIVKGGTKIFAKRRFPYLQDDLSVT